MKIIPRFAETTEVKDLKAADCFMYAGVVYIKINSPTITTANAVNLESGELHHFSSNCKVCNLPEAILTV